MRTHDETNEPKAPAQSDQETSAQKPRGRRNPEELPDGTGTDAKKSESGPGQEDGGKPFDAG